MIPDDTKARTTPRGLMPRSLMSPAAETRRTYLLIAATLLVMLGLGFVAIESGAIDALNASRLLGGRP